MTSSILAPTVKLFTPIPNPFDISCADPEGGGRMSVSIGSDLMVFLWWVLYRCSLGL